MSARKPISGQNKLKMLKQKRALCTEMEKRHPDKESDFWKVFTKEERDFQSHIEDMFEVEYEMSIQPDWAKNHIIQNWLETANMIVGSAKVIAENSKTPYTINTPHFEKIGDFDFEYDDIKVIQVEDDKLTIAIKEL